MTQLHEDLTRDESLSAKVASERSFGLVFAAVFVLVGVYPLMQAQAPHWWALLLSGAIGLLAWLQPGVFRVPNRLWFRLGNVLAAIVGPVAIGIVFLVAVVPTGLLLRAFGKDPLRLRFSPEAKSYWIERKPPGPAPRSLRNQF